MGEQGGIEVKGDRESVRKREGRKTIKAKGKEQ